MEVRRLAVRMLVEEAMKCGDIDSRYVDQSTVYEGARAHRMLQKQMGDGYQKEVSLQMDTEVCGVKLRLFGRADGVIDHGDGSFTVDEIKTTTLPLEKLSAQQDAHMAQAKCYAHMLLEKLTDKPPEITIRLTYYQLESKETQRREWQFTPDEIRAFFTGLLDTYAVWLQFERDWLRLRDASIREMKFPFEKYREGQRDMAVAVYSAIYKEKRLYVQAPTGIGKTLSTLFPSIKALAEGGVERLFYLTAKTVTRTVAEDALRLMAEQGLRIKALTFRAKDKICFCEESICNPDYCPYAKGHYDRVNAALLDILNGEDIITPDIVSAYARKHSVCPHEYALDIALHADTIICDYNHIFDPRVYLKRFFADGGGDYVFLIDEAHNLYDRVRDMYTAAIKKSEFLALRRALQDRNAAARRLKAALSAVDKHLLEKRKKLGTERRGVDAALDEALVALLKQFIKDAEAWLAQEQHSGHPLQEEMLALYFATSAFIGISEEYGGHYTSITEVYGSEVTHTLFCLDPSSIIGARLLFARAAVLFSATLTPLPYYRRILGGTESDGMLALGSPFTRERLCLVAHRGISTKYLDREASIAPVAEAIHRVASQKRGNYIAYFPSYDYMRDIYAAFTERYPAIPTLLQEGGMSEDERSAFLARFDGESDQALLGFCVLGGIFSEGIDLKGSRLIGSIIVGVGLPRISLRQDLVREYFDRTENAGFDYAYVFPGMNKVLQAAGRVIRTEEDYGVVALIDSRFATEKYRALYPPHWAHMQYARNNEELGDTLQAFAFFKE